MIYSLVFIFLTFLMLVIFIVNRKKFILLLPTFYVLFQFVTSIIPGYSNIFKYGFNFVSIFGIILSLYLSKTSLKYYKIIIIFTLYLLLMYLLRSDEIKFARLATVILFTSSFLLFIVVKNTIYSKKDLIFFFNTSYFNLIISLVYLFSIQVVHSSNTYTTYSGEFYVGAFFTTGIYFAAYNLIIVFYDYYYKITTRSQNIKIFLFVLWIAVLILIMRRTALIMVFLSLSIFALLERTSLVKTFLIIIGILLSLFFISTFFGKFFEDQMVARNKIFDRRGEDYITEEARYAEVVYLLDLRLNGNLIDLFLGRNLLDNRELGYNYAGKERPLHTDWSVIFHGGGILGIILFLLIYTYFYKYVIRIRGSNNLKHLVLVFFVISVLVSFPGGYLRLFQSTGIISIIYGFYANKQLINEER